MITWVDVRSKHTFVYDRPLVSDLFITDHSYQTCS